jgi:hypothetical protein
MNFYMELLIFSVIYVLPVILSVILERKNICFSIFYSLVMLISFMFVAKRALYTKYYNCLFFLSIPIMILFLYSFIKNNRKGTLKYIYICVCMFFMIYTYISKNHILIDESNQLNFMLLGMGILLVMIVALFRNILFCVIKYAYINMHSKSQLKHSTTPKNNR